MKFHLINVLENSPPKSSKSNLSNQEKKALTFFQKNKNKDIFIKPTDKNVGPSLVGNEWYFNECYRQLSDYVTYAKLSKERKDEIIQEAIFILQHLCKKYSDILDFKEKNYILSKIKQFAVPLFYIFPKKHKTSILGRPIVAGHSWILTPASVICGHYLKQLEKLYSYLLQDSKNLIMTLESLNVPKNCLLITVDFDSLYTRIPIGEAIQCIKELFQNYLIPQADLIIALLNSILYLNVIEFNGEFYLQISGLGMGTSLASTFANIFVGWLQMQQNIPTDPLAGYAEIDHKTAESQGYLKIDFLNNYIYKDVKDIAHLDSLVKQEPMWELLEHQEIVSQLYHINRYYDILKEYKPKNVMELAMILAIIRPAKKHLIGQSFDKISKTVWEKPLGDEYHFKKAHAVAFALAICVQLNLIIEKLVDPLN